MITELQNTRSQNLDQMTTEEIITLMNYSNQEATQAVTAAHNQINAVIKAVIDSFKNHGRLFYIGAGTSGRLGVLDASECPPTFSAYPEMVCGIIAGGDIALKKSVENVEDDPAQAIIDLKPYNLNARDIVIGISANGNAPYVLSALRHAKDMLCKTALITCNPVTKPAPFIDYYINLLVGPEIITGSTRLKAGTATKMVLNEISTVAMIAQGKVFDNLMIDLKICNKKLAARAYRIIHKILTCVDADISDNQIDKLLIRAHNEVKTAIVMQIKKIDYAMAKILIAQHNGFLRPIITQEIV